MSAARTPLLDALAEHDERVEAAMARVRALARDAADHAEQIGRLRDERVAAYADDDEHTAAALKRRAAEADERAVELDERRQGAQIAARRAQADRDDFIRSNLAGLLAERAPVARAAVERIEAAIAALGEGVEAWHAEARAAAALLRAAGERTDGVADLGALQGLARDVRRAAAEGVPAPTPGGELAAPARSRAKRPSKAATS